MPIAKFDEQLDELLQQAEEERSDSHRPLPPLDNSAAGLVARAERNMETIRHNFDAEVDNNPDWSNLNDWPRSDTLAHAQVLATLAQAQATLALVKAYDGHNTRVYPEA
jgi:hypothetical protein